MAKTYSIDLNAPLVLTDSKTGVQLKTVPLAFVTQTLAAIVAKYGSNPDQFTASIKLAASAMPAKAEDEEVDVKVLQAAIDDADFSDSKWLTRVIGQYLQQTGNKVGATEVAILLKAGVVKRGS